MDTTDCLGLPYPECNPPLTQDASDIAQLEALAVATDAAVQDLADSIQDVLVAPDAIKMSGGDNTAGRDVEHFLFGAIWTNNPAMEDTVAGVIRIQETGWYYVGGTVRVATATSIFLTVEPIVNDAPVSGRQGPSVTNGIAEDIAWADTLFLQAGDGLRIATHHVGSTVTVFTYSFLVWAQRILINV